MNISTVMFWQTQVSRFRWLRYMEARSGLSKWKQRRKYRLALQKAVIETFFITMTVQCAWYTQLFTPHYFFVFKIFCELLVLHDAGTIYIMIELCFFSLHQWEIKVHLLWGKSFNTPHWPRNHSTNGRLQHIEELSKSKTRVGTIWFKWLLFWRQLLVSLSRAISH